MKKITLSMILCLSFCNIFWAKNIKGLVVDKFRQPVEFANISVFIVDSIVDGCITDSIGVFALTIPDKANHLHVSLVGYESKYVVISSPNIGEIILSPSVTTLKEVVVKAPLIRREADRIVLNVAANPLSANKDAQELLKTAPGVWATDDRLSIYGQGGTAVYIDDRKVNMSGNQLMTYLKSIQSASIATIEIIPKAGAEYSADSSGGVIRINLKRNRVDGINGSAGLNLTAGEYNNG